MLDSDESFKTKNLFWDGGFAFRAALGCAAERGCCVQVGAVQPDVAVVCNMVLGSPWLKKNV